MPRIEVPGSEHPIHGFFPSPNAYPGPGWGIKHVKKSNKTLMINFGDRVRFSPGVPKGATDEDIFRRYYAITNFCAYHSTANTDQIKNLLMEHQNEDLHLVGRGKSEWESARRGMEMLRSNPAFSAASLVEQAENVLRALNDSQQSSRQITLRERIVAAMSGAVWQIFTTLFQGVLAQQVDAIMDPEGTYDEAIETVGATMVSTVGGFDFDFFQIGVPDEYTAGDCILYVGTLASGGRGCPRGMVIHSSVKSLAIHNLLCNLKREKITLGAGNNEGMIVDIMKNILATQDFMWVLEHDDHAEVWTMEKLTQDNFHDEMKKNGLFYRIMNY
ncbi:hypothetical protein ACHAWC_005962 [Mediolabrus comicus]